MVTRIQDSEFRIQESEFSSQKSTIQNPECFIKIASENPVLWTGFFILSPVFWSLPLIEPLPYNSLRSKDQYDYEHDKSDRLLVYGRKEETSDLLGQSQGQSSGE